MQIKGLPDYHDVCEISPPRRQQRCPLLLTARTLPESAADAAL